MEDKKQDPLVAGLYVQRPQEGAPDFVKARFGLKIPEFSKFIQENRVEGDDWLNFDLLVSKGGKLYMKLNTWKPEKNENGTEKSDLSADEIPF